MPIKWNKPSIYKEVMCIIKQYVQNVCSELLLDFYTILGIILKLQKYDGL